jgi:BirA family transcriptional regulator, biotin operon repressor / biotin---[acetyl-CoA-carboxylase] ligase
MNWTIRELAVTESTNDDAKKAAEAGEAAGLVIWALLQTAGRGRQGRTWESPEGNLYCSLLLRPVCESKDFSQYAFVAALAIYDAVKALAPKAALTLKWPNDVLADQKKISGVLLESGPGWLVTGIGLNILNHPEGGLYPATSLHALGVKTDPKTALDRLLESFGRWQATLRKDGFAPIRAAWLERAGRGRLTVKLPQGVLEGVFAGLAPDGALCLKLADGSERAIATGDVFLSTGS